jgi:hypothetical protein
MPDSNTPHTVRYDPADLLDAVQERLLLNNDAQLARLLDVQPPLISKIRNRHLPVGAAFLIRLHEASGLSIVDMRRLMGDRRGRFQIGRRETAQNGSR